MLACWRLPMSQNPLSMLTPDTPLKPLIVCASGCEVQLRVVLCLWCPTLQSLCTSSSSAVLKCWHYRNVKNVKTETKQPPHRQNHTICICIYTCPYKYTEIKIKDFHHFNRSPPSTSLFLEWHLYFQGRLVLCWFFTIFVDRKDNTKKAWEAQRTQGWKWPSI